MKIDAQMNKALLKHLLLSLIILIINTKGFTQNQREDLHLLHIQVTADSYFNDYMFAEALTNYLKYFEGDSSNSEVNYKIGLCYLNISEHENALPYLNMVIKDTAYLKPHIYYYSAKAHQLEHNFDQAITFYKNYLGTLPEDEEYLSEVNEIKREIDKCLIGKEFLKNPNSKEPINLGSIINSEYPDYGAVLNADESTLIFTSERPSTTGGKKSKLDGSFHDDIYVSKKVNNEWSKPMPINELNTNHDDAAVSISHDGHKLITYHYGHSSLLHSSGDLYLSKLESDTWSKPEKLGNHINSKYRESSACFSNSDNELYFVSDRPGGYGGLDIYKVSKNQNGEWNEPENLGAEINTPFDEESPFIHPDGKTFYFSSEGHKNMGGFDIFKATLNDENKWSKPVNLGYPINTANNDVYFTVSANGKHIYFSDHRKKNSFGHEDIYYAEINVDKSNILLLSGVIKNKGGEKLEAEIEILDKSTQEIISLTTSNKTTGKFIIVVSEGRNYEVKIVKKGFKNYSFKLNTEDLTEYHEEKRFIELKEK